MDAKSTNNWLKIVVIIAIILFLIFVFLDRINPSESLKRQEARAIQTSGSPK
jgi:hypothetical protein